MKTDESFEQEVRVSIRASAPGQAPDDLVARIGEIPAREPSPRAGVRGLSLAARLAVNLAAAAVVVIAVAALIVSRNGGNLPAGGQANGSGSVATAGVSLATAGDSAAPSAMSACGSPVSPNPASSPGMSGSTAATGPVVVTLGIYSGVSDPAWTLTVVEAAGVDAALAALPEGTGTPSVGGLGYHGFTITRPGSTLVAYAGAVAPPGDGPRAMKADPARSIERCLLELSRSHVTLDEYAIAQLAIAAPGASAAPSATSPAASPAASPPPATPGASTALLGLVPSPASVTFVSADEGWVLGTGTCSISPCAAIARTVDGGRTWAGVPAPGAAIVPGPDQATSGISGLRFADDRNGWAFGPDLWATHDGGATWARLTIPGLPADAAIVALETANGTVQAAVLDGEGYRVASSAVGTDDFHLSAVRVPVGAGPVPAVQLVLSGAAGWLIENDRTVVGGARLVNGTWVVWKPPCSDVVGPAFVAASGPTELAAACDVGLWGNPAGDHLYLSHDGGSTFVESATTVPLQAAGQVAPASTSVIVVGGSDATGAILVGTFDGGRTWTIVAQLGAVQIADLGFTTATQGVVITVSSDGPASLLMTRDGGRTWSGVGAAGPAGGDGSSFVFDPSSSDSLNAQEHQFLYSAIKPCPRAGCETASPDPRFAWMRDWEAPVPAEFQPCLTNINGDACSRAIAGP